MPQLPRFRQRGGAALIERDLTPERSMDLLRHADANYDVAIAVAMQRGVKRLAA
jgi:urocanate hydratase